MVRGGVETYVVNTVGRMRGVKEERGDNKATEPEEEEEEEGYLGRRTAEE